MSSTGSKLNREKRRREATYRRGYEDGVAAKDALSAAEPVAWLVKRYDLSGVLLDTELSFTRPSIKSTCRTEMAPLYAAPALTVAVKEPPYHCDVCTVPGYGDAPCSPLCDRPSLTAQVQGVAPLQNVRSEVTHEDICDTHEGGTCNCDWSAADEGNPHPDDIAVDRFAIAMKTKLAKKRDEGRGGWEDKDDCSHIFLSQLLREHVEKGDPVDVGNFAMMLHQREERIASLLETLQGE